MTANTRIAAIAVNTGVALIVAAALVCAETQPPARPKDRTRPTQVGRDQTISASSGQSAPGQPPITVVLPSKTPDQLKGERDDRQRKIDVQASIGRFTFWLVVVGVLQLAAIVFGFIWTRRAANAAERSANAAVESVGALKSQVQKMGEIADAQTRDMRDAIAQAVRSADESVRAADAMERVAASMAESAQSVNQSVELARQNAERQERLSVLISRPYLASTFVNMIEQVGALRFQPRVAIVNLGNTPAYNVRSLARVGVHPRDLPPGFAFPMNPLPAQVAGSVIGPRMNRIVSDVAPEVYQADIEQSIRIGGNHRLYMWGEVRYEDAFRNERVLRYAAWFLNTGQNQWMMFDVPGYQEAT